MVQDNYFDVDDADDEFADAVIETEEYASARASARASANMVPAVGLKATDGTLCNIMTSFVTRFAIQLTRIRDH